VQICRGKLFHRIGASTAKAANAPKGVIVSCLEEAQ